MAYWTIDWQSQPWYQLKLAPFPEYHILLKTDFHTLINIFGYIFKVWFLFISQLKKRKNAMNWSEYSVNLHSNHSCIFTDIIFWSGRGRGFRGNVFPSLEDYRPLDNWLMWTSEGLGPAIRAILTFKSWMLEIAMELLLLASVVRNQDVSENSMTDLCKACLFCVWYRPWFICIYE